MSGNARGWKLLSLALVGMLLPLGMSSLLLYSQLTVMEEKYRSTVKSLADLSYSVDLLINYGNGTKVWHNDSRVPLEYNLYNATVLITGGKVKATYYPQYQTHFVNSIDGVGESKDPGRSSWAWITWYYNDALGRWESYDVGADMVTLKNRERVAWHYQDTSKYPDLTPPN